MQTRHGGSDLILERLKALHPKLIDLSLDRIRGLLSALGDPHDALPPVVHLAGTNGKGSTLAFLEAVLCAAGYRVHAYTSPHLVRFHERIRLAGNPIDEDRLESLLMECETANSGAPITFFEITTAAALLAFAREPADIVLLETGLGGRLDATNVVARPALTVITPISHDHHGYLGTQLTMIAAEKAGIMKADVPAVVAAQPPAVLKVLETRAKQLRTPLICQDREWFVTPWEQGFHLSIGNLELDLPRPALTGRHQIGNGGLAAVAALTLPGVSVDTRALAAGLSRTDWPARLQRIRRGPLSDTAPQDWDLWLDGGHNPAAGAALAEQARAWSADERPLHMVFGMLDSKMAEDFLRPLAPYMDAVRAVTVPGEPASLTTAQAVTAARKVGMAAKPASSVLEAVRDITATAPGPARLLICGSLYLAGSVLRENG